MIISSKNPQYMEKVNFGFTDMNGVALKEEDFVFDIKKKIFYTERDNIKIGAANLDDCTFIFGKDCVAHIGHRCLIIHKGNCKSIKGYDCNEVVSENIKTSAYVRITV